MNHPASALIRSLAPLWALWLAVAGFVVPGAPARAAEPAAKAAASAPAIEGTLPNGVRYTLLPHRRDLGRVSVRLVVHAGSLDERDGERGFAHFVEHLAFQGSRHYPPGKVREFFQSLGLADGADLNAHTGFAHTTYKIDLPAARTARLAEALRVLRDFADGIEFPTAEVARERAVVLSEAAARDTDDHQSTRQRIAALYPGTPFPTRLPIGENADLNRSTAESLRAFYRRCYSPARMAVVITGDIEPAATRRLVTEHFATLRPDASAAPQVLPPDPISAGGPQAHIITSAGALAANFSLVAVERSAPKTKPDFRTAWVTQIAIDALHQRLRARRSREGARFGLAAATRADGADGRFAHFVVEASAATNDWPAAVALVEAELRHTITQGFAPAELQEQVATRVAWARAAVDQTAGETPDDLANKIAAALAAGHDWPHPAAIAAYAAEFAPTLTPEETTAALRTLFAPERLQLLLTRRDAPAGGTEAVLAAWRESAARPLESAPSPGVPLAFRYGPAAQPGKVASRRTEPDLGLELVAFANGARLNLRASGTEPGRFRLAARLGRGVVDFPRERPGLPHLAAHLLKEADLGRHTRDEVRRLLRTRALSSHATFDHRYLYEISGPVAELPFALQLITAEFSDAKLEATRFTQALSDTSGCRAGQLDDGADHAREGIIALMAGGDSRLHEPPPTWSGDYTLTETITWLTAHWLDGPLEVALTGDFDPDGVITAGAASIGTLRRLRDPAPTRTGWPVLRAQPKHETQHVPLADKAAAVRLAWPARGDADSAQRPSLRLATHILLDRYHRSLREELGVTYSPEGGIYALPLHHAFAFASVALTFAPERAPDLTRRAVALAEEFARTGATPEEFARLREPLRSSATESLRSNEWWLDDVLAHAQSDPAALADARAMAGGFDRLTLDEVNRAAAGHFRSELASSLIVLPVAPAPPAPEIEPATSEDFVQRAIARTNEGNLDGALADFERALTLNPKNEDAYVNRSAVKMARGNLDGAIADCTKAIELDPTLALAHANRAGARLARGDLDGCITDATKAIELDPTSAVAYVNRGAARGNKGELDAAIADSTKAIENDPRNADGYNNRAYMRQLKGELDAALPDFDRAIELNPRSTNSYRNRGIIHQTKGRAAAALGDYDKTIELSPDDVVARVHRGIIRQQKGDLEGSIADYDHSIRLDPTNADAFNNRGHTKQLKGDLDGAIADFTKAIELRPDYALAYNNRGHTKRLKGDRFGAIDDLDHGSRISAPVRPTAAAASTGTPSAPAPSPALALIRSGNAKRTNRNRDLDGALADYEKALQQDPSAAEAFLGRALVHTARNNPTGALADLDNAIALEPTLTAAYIERGNLRRNQRDFPRALADYTKAIALDSKSASAYYGRGFVRENQNNYTGAFADYDMAITLNAAFVPAYNGRGHTRQMQGDYDRAILDYNEAIRRSPNFTLAFFNRGVSHRAAGNLAAALADFDKLIGLIPNYATAHTNRASVRAALGDYAGAAADYEKAVARTSSANAYTRLFQWINQRRLNPAAPAAEFARAVAAWPEGWEKTVGQFLLGQIPEDRFLADAKATAGRTPQIRASESNYFAAMKRLIDGDSAGARPLLEQSVNARQPLRFTHTLARAELARLQIPTPPP